MLDGRRVSYTEEFWLYLYMKLWLQLILDSTQSGIHDLQPSHFPCCSENVQRSGNDTIPFLVRRGLISKAVIPAFAIIAKSFAIRTLAPKWRILRVSVRCQLPSLEILRRRPSSTPEAEDRGSTTGSAPRPTQHGLIYHKPRVSHSGHHVSTRTCTRLN